MEHCREIVFAAWLANIQRFYEKGAVQLVQMCSEILGKYMIISDLLGIIRQDEQFKEEAGVVKYACEISLYESEKKEVQTKTRNLTTVFSRVNIKEEERVGKKYYPLLKESVKSVFPQSLADDSEMEKMAEDFGKELKELKNTPPATWESFIVVFDSLARKYMWCITASDYEGEDVSLYNQSRIAAAIAGCICQTSADETVEIDRDRKWFKLAVCDFSGIQKYVFSVANTSESGVAKRLRARSFFVDVTVSVIAQAMIERFHLTQNHILMQTGGKFYLLLPNTKDSEDILNKIEYEIEDSFYSMFKGQVAIHLAWIPLGAAGLEDYSASVTKLMQELGEKKAQAFNHILIRDGEWDTDKFIVNKELKGKTICTSCQQELADKEMVQSEEHCYCKNCQMQTEIGALLPRTKYIYYYRGKGKDRYPIYGEYTIALRDTVKLDDAFLIEQINGDEAGGLKGLPVRKRFMANHIPVKNTEMQGKEVMTFNDIAETAKGIHKLAVLKADVDNLGYIFADGLRTGKRHFGTLSRVNTMSRFLEIFFSGKINEMLEEREEFKNVYSVFSGGDDLFLIGPWDVMPKLAIEIEEQFNRFTAENPALTISATVSTFHAKEHIANMAEISEESLKKVKTISDEKIYPEKKGKGRNGVSFMGMQYSWSDLEAQINIGDKLSELLQKQIINSSMLRRIGIYSTMYQKFLKDNDVMSLMFEPLFHYDRERNYGEISKKEENRARWFKEEYIEDLSKNIADCRNIKKNLYFAEADVAYAMNLTKEDRKNGLQE